MADEHSDAHDHHTGPGHKPAVGEWRCRATEFDAGFVLATLRIVRFVSLTLSGLTAALAAIRVFEKTQKAAILPAIPYTSTDYAIVASVVAAAMAIWVYSRTYRPIANRAEGTFHVTVTFDGNAADAITGGRISWTTEWIENRVPPTPKPGDGLALETPQAAAVLQNVLPRLYQLQRSADGKHGLLRITGNTSKRTFQCARHPSHDGFLRLGHYVSIGVATVTSFAFLALFAVYFGAQGLLANADFAARVGFHHIVGALALASWIWSGYLSHRVRLPALLHLTIEKRPQADIVVVEWTEYHGWRAGVHKQWALLSDVHGLTVFCHRVASLEGAVKMEDLAIDEPRPTASRSSASATPRSIKNSVQNPIGSPMKFNDSISIATLENEAGKPSPHFQKLP